jgi:hypothetical protein
MEAAFFLIKKKRKKNTHFGMGALSLTRLHHHHQIAHDNDIVHAIMVRPPLMASPKLFT